MKIANEMKKRDSRRDSDLILAEGCRLEYDEPTAPKKPIDFQFDKNNKSSFELPFALGNNMLEKKSDGYCLMISKKDDDVHMYSSGGLEWNPGAFPEVMDDFRKVADGYYHAEILGLKNKDKWESIDEFTSIEKRPKNKAPSSELVKAYPLKIDIFDALSIDDKRIMHLPFAERRAKLEAIIDEGDHVRLIEQHIVNDIKGMQSALLDALAKGYEGMVAKNPGSLYVPGSRDNDWIKLKAFTTLDLAVLGFYETPESRKAGKPFSAVLVGTYNKGKLETMAKVKVGALKDQEDIISLVKTVKTNGDYKKAVSANPYLIVNPEMAKIARKIPDSIVKYNPARAAIVEVQFLDVTNSENWHSCGLSNGKAYSLRLATFKQLRTDKTRYEHATSTKNVVEYAAK